MELPMSDYRKTCIAMNRDVNDALQKAFTVLRGNIIAKNGIQC